MLESSLKCTPKNGYPFVYQNFPEKTHKIQNGEKRLNKCNRIFILWAIENETIIPGHLSDLFNFISIVTFLNSNHFDSEKSELFVLICLDSGFGFGFH